MSKAEVLVLLAQLDATIGDLRDIRFDAPPHVAAAIGERIAAIQEAAREIRRLHGL